MDYLNNLNPSQRAAVEYCDGPQLIIAGAGSGKTRVLTCKIAYLLQNGYHPDDIIALTFTKKAATEMQQRIEQLVGAGAAHRLWMGTFHSLFGRILRREAGRLGFKSDFTIYDQTDSRSLVKAIIKEMGLDDKTYKPNAIQSIISNAKNALVTPGMYLANREIQLMDARAKRPSIGQIYQQYWNRCYQAGAMDFDDLLLYTNILFRDHPDVLQFYQDYFKYVLVDEYQDTNRAQHLIIEQLVRQHKHLCVVGDDAQSIYSFRGANIRNILDLRTQIPGTQLFKLEQNYRSTQNIVDAANSLIAKNREQIHKNVYSEKERGSLLRLTGSYSDIEEAYKVSVQIEAFHAAASPYKDCAILYRTNSQSRVLEEALRKKDIPYRIVGGTEFYQRKEIKTAHAFFHLIVNPNDEEAFKRAINETPSKIGATTLAKIGQAISQAAAEHRSILLLELCHDPLAFGVEVNRGTIGHLARFAEHIEKCQAYSFDHNLYETMRFALIEFGYSQELAADTTVEGQSRRENIEELLNSLQQQVVDAIESGSEIPTISEYLSNISLAESGPEKRDPNADEVLLMTIHQAKGLEFPNVFITGIEEGLMPSEMSLDEPGGVEEERRLFYVAITRAEKNCFLSYASSRFRNGRSEACRPSRFIKDIDRKYIDQKSTQPAPPPSFDPTKASFGSGSSSFASSPASFGSRPTATPALPHSVPPTPQRSVLDLNNPRKVAVRTQELKPKATLTYGGQVLEAGTRIAHNRFGLGTIVELEGEGENARISVRFDSVGDKTLLLKFAKFTLA